MSDGIPEKSIRFLEPEQIAGGIRAIGTDKLNKTESFTFVQKPVISGRSSKISGGDAESLILFVVLWWYPVIIILY